MKTKYLRMLMLLGIAFLWQSVLAIPAAAQVSIRVGIQLPAIVFSSPPELIVIPNTYVYVVPDVDDDIFFYDGWWWRPYRGQWYRSRSYDRGWNRYSYTPRFYREVPQDWRNEYRQHQWRGQPWNYQRIPDRQVQQNWNTWKRDKYWEKHDTWGVQGYQHQPQSKFPQYRNQQPAHQGQQHQAPQPAYHNQHPQDQQQGHQDQQHPQAQQPAHQDQQHPQAQQPAHQNQQPQAQQPKNQGKVKKGKVKNSKGQGQGSKDANQRGDNNHR